MSTSTAVLKPARPGRPVFYDALKAPQMRGTEEHPEPTLVLVRNGKEVHLPCSAALFARVDGRRRKGASHTGYDNLRDYSFVAWEHEGKVVDIDRINCRLQEYPDQKVHAEKDEAQTTVDVEFTREGTMHISATPPKVSKTELFGIIKALNAMQNPETEKAVPSRFEISEVGSKMIRLIVVSK